MTQELYKQFREDFQSIVFFYGLVKSNRAHISTMYQFDKDGSHTKAIDKATEKWKENKAILEEKLAKYGFKKYEEARDCSKRLTALMQRISNNKKSCARYTTPPLKVRTTFLKLLEEFSKFQLNSVENDKENKENID